MFVPVTHDTPLCELHGLRLHMEPCLERLSGVRIVVRRFLRPHLADLTLIDDLVMALDEALSNVVLYAQPAAGQPVLVTVQLEGRRAGQPDLVTISLKDQGAGGRTFDPAHQLAESLARTATGEQSALGLLLIYRVMDLVDYDSSPEHGNVLTLRKYLPAHGAERNLLPSWISAMQQMGAGQS